MPADADQFRRVAELAGTSHEEAARCADAGAFHAACAMIGCAAEAALLATAAIFEGDLRQQGRWHRDKPLEKWTLNDLTALARQAAWLPAPGSGEPPDLNDSEAGDAIESARRLRNLAAHPGRHIREATQARLGETAYRNAHGIVGAVFDATYSVIQSLDTVGRPGESGGDALTGRGGR